MAIPLNFQINLSNIIGETGVGVYNPSVAYAALPASLGLKNPTTTTHFSGNSDDAYVAIPLGFSFNFLGTSYSTVYIGSNSYITFTGGSASYNGMDYPYQPSALAAVKLSAWDNSYQKVTSGKPFGNGTLTIRWEGTASTGGTLGSPNMVWEVTFFARASEMLIVWGQNARGLSTAGGGTNNGGITNGTSYVYTNDAVFNGNNCAYWVANGIDAPIKLGELSAGSRFSINQYSTNKPDTFNPHRLGEWRGYDHFIRPEYVTLNTSVIDIDNNDNNWYSNPNFPGGPGDAYVAVNIVKNYDYDNATNINIITPFPSIENYNLAAEAPVLDTLLIGDTLNFDMYISNDAYEGQANISFRIIRNGTYVVTESNTDPYGYVNLFVQYTIPAGTTSLAFEVVTSIPNNNY
jgi:hypothetical protein